MVQGELFREEDNVSNYSNSSLYRKKSFLSRFQLTLSLDKLLIGLIGLTVVFVLTYSFGVERGKRVMEKQLQTMFPPQSDSIITVGQPATESQSVPQATEKQTVLLVNEPLSSEREGAQKDTSEPVEVSDKTTPPPLAAVLSKGKYTVQLVTYNSAQLAEREIKRLQSKGHQGFLIPSGPHYQVCVNYFETRGKATDFLKGFPESNRYPGAYIRPVVR